MNLAIPYLMFSGNCHEALKFYETCLDGKITKLQTVAEAPFDVPKGMEHRIFDSEFKAGSVHFKASDDMPGNEVNVGSNFALFIGSPDAAERERVFDKLSEGGHISFPLDDNFGMVTDKFNIQWMIARTAE